MSCETFYYLWPQAYTAVRLGWHSDCLNYGTVLRYSETTPTFCDTGIMLQGKENGPESLKLTAPVPLSCMWYQVKGCVPSHRKETSSKCHTYCSKGLSYLSEPHCFLHIHYSLKDIVVLLFSVDGLNKIPSKCIIFNRLVFPAI